MFIDDKEKCPKCGNPIKIPCFDRLYEEPPGEIYYHLHEVDGKECLAVQLKEEKKKTKLLELDFKMREFYNKKRKKRK